MALGNFPNEVRHLRAPAGAASGPVEAFCGAQRHSALTKLYNAMFTAFNGLKMHLTSKPHPAICYSYTGAIDSILKDT